MGAGVPARASSAREHLTGGNGTVGVGLGLRQSGGVGSGGPGPMSLLGPESERSSPGATGLHSLQLPDSLSPHSSFLQVLKRSDNQDAAMLGSPCPPSHLPGTQIRFRPIRLQQLLISCFPGPVHPAQRGPGAGAVPGPVPPWPAARSSRGWIPHQNDQHFCLDVVGSGQGGVPRPRS